MLKQLRTSLVILGSMTLLTGVVYPVVVTVLSQIAFSHQANGSFLYGNSQPVESELIGQSFTKPEYFWGRLSATSPNPYDATSSNGSNYGPLNPDLTKNANARIAALKEYDSELTTIPVDLATASASGLDPHISPAAAEVQIRRVAVARRMTENDVRDLVRRHTLGRQFGLLGEPRVTVLQLNLALDSVARK